MLILTIYNNNNLYFFLWLWIITVITSFIEIAGDFHIDIYLHCIFIIHIHTTSPFLHLHFLSSHWAVTFGFVNSSVQAMFCHLELNFFLSSRKDGGIAGVNNLKRKNNVTHWKTIIPGQSKSTLLRTFGF